MKCAIIYGALPMESRTQQARLFNDPASGYDILVATDAIGMGLNLNIRRIVFYTIRKPTKKDDTIVVENLPMGMVKQIAGRAGRYNSHYPEGFVTTFYQQDYPYLRQCLKYSGHLLTVIPI
jgi:ATP-dependent RNA helicase SUPV3L1/SUV3